MLASTEAYSVNHLPIELLEYTFSFLESKDLLLAERVSKTWQEVANSETLWRRHCESKYGKNYLASLAFPNPKAGYILPQYIKFSKHYLKPLPIQNEWGILSRMELHGQYLIITKLTPTIPSIKVIFDLIRQESIQVPEFLKKSSFRKWTMFKNEQIVVIQDKIEQLFFSKPPYNSKTMIGSKGTLLDVCHNQLFFTSPDKRQLARFTLGQNAITFTMDFKDPIQSFFASEFAHAALFENEVIIFKDPTDLYKNFTVPLDSKNFTPKVVANEKWLIITSEGRDIAFFLAYDIVNDKLHSELCSPTSFNRVFSVNFLDICNGLDLCDSALILTRRHASAVNLETISTRGKNPEIISLEFHRDSTHLSSFANRFFFSNDGIKSIIKYTDFLTNSDGKMDLDLSINPRKKSNAVINGRFVVVSYYGDTRLAYSDLLAPERTSSKHFAPLGDKREVKKIRI